MTPARRGKILAGGGLPAGLLLLLAGLQIAPLALRPGWPFNHEGLRFFERTEVIRRALAHGIFYPIWWPTLQYGFGSPMPLLYHRLFFELSGLAALALPSLKSAVLSAIFLLLWAGGLGMLRLLRILLDAHGAAWRWRSGADRLALMGAVLFLFSPYCWTEWVIRGAVAELSACMLVPWILAELVLIGKKAKANFAALSILAVLLFHAHVMMAFFIYGLMAAFLVTYWLGHRPPLSFFGPALKWLPVPAVGIGVPFLAMERCRRLFNTGILTGAPWRPRDNLAAMHRYFYDSSFLWGEQSRDLSVEINRFVLAALFLTLLAAAAFRLPRRGWIFSFFALSALALLALQSPWSLPFYEHVPLVSYLQFPWRLLGLLAPICVILLVLSCGELLRWRGAYWELAVALPTLLTFFFFAQGAALSYPWYSAEAIATVVHELDGFQSVGEYLPLGVRLDDVHLRPLLQVNEPCRVVRAEVSEAGEISAELESPAPCTGTLRQFRAPLLAASIENGKFNPDGVIYSFTTAKGATRILVRPKSLLSFAFSTE